MFVKLMYYNTQNVVIKRGMMVVILSLNMLNVVYSAVYKLTCYYNNNTKHVLCVHLTL